VSAFHLAQVNIAAGDEVGGLEPINALADGSPGFVWRLQDESGDATSIRPFGDESILVNMSVWESLDVLRPTPSATTAREIGSTNGVRHHLLTHSEVVRSPGSLGRIPDVTTDALPPTPDRVEHELADGVLTIRLVHEGKANALTEPMLNAVVRILNGPDGQAARAAIVTGDGDKHFSSGAELGTDTVDAWAERIKRIEHGISAVGTAITKARFPVIAAINGDAVGGGLEVAMACDWRVARSGARFAMPPARLGLVYTAEGMRRFVSEIGLARTRELFLTARAMDADAARQVGLVNHVVAPGELMQVARRMAEAVAANAPLAVEGMRDVLRAIADNDSPDGKAQQFRVKAFGSADLTEGVTAARERRPPTFTGA
jgi:enoyl-CoA hydratase/carnithine racemase